MNYSIVIDTENDLTCLNEFLINETMFRDTSIVPSFISSIGKKAKLASNEDFHTDWEYLKFLYFLYLLHRVSDEDQVKLYERFALNLHLFIKSQDGSVKEIGEIGHHNGPCIPGQIRLFMNVDGQLFPCERVNELSKANIIGNIDDGFDYEKINNLLNIGELTSNECKSCFAFRNCNICARLAVSGDELSRSEKLKACTNSKHQFDEILKDTCTLYTLGYRDEVVR